MSDIVEKMSDQVPEGFFGFEVFLAADMTIAAVDDSAAIKTILLFTLGQVRHNNFFLKISTINTSLPCFSLLYN